LVDFENFEGLVVVEEEDIEIWSSAFSWDYVEDFMPFEAFDDSEDGSG
jgi:hypothetical protein